MERNLLKPQCITYAAVEKERDTKEETKDLGKSIVLAM